MREPLRVASFVRETVPAPSPAALAREAMDLARSHSAVAIAEFQCDLAALIANAEVIAALETAPVGVREICRRLASDLPGPRDTLTALSQRQPRKAR